MLQFPAQRARAHVAEFPPQVVLPADWSQRITQIKIGMKTKNVVVPEARGASTTFFDSRTSIWGFPDLRTRLPGNFTKNVSKIVGVKPLY